MGVGVFARENVGVRIEIDGGDDVGITVSILMGVGVKV
jgi:hypothetical protein